MKGCVAGTGSGARFHCRRLGRAQLAAGRIETENEHAVEAFVRHQHEAAGRIENDVMRVRTGLLFGVRPRLALQADQLNLVREPAVLPHGEHRDAARGVVADHHEPAARVRRQVHPVGVAGFGTVQESKESGFRVHREGRGIGFVAVDGVEKSLVSAEDQKGRVDQVSNVLNVAPGARLPVHAVDMDAVTVRVPLPGCIAAGVGENFAAGLRCLAGLRCHGRGERACQNGAAGHFPAFFCGVRAAVEGGTIPLNRRYPTTFP